MSNQSSSAAEWGGLQPRLAGRLPYVRWLERRDENKASEVEQLRLSLPLLASLGEQDWAPAMATARQEVAAASGETGYTGEYRAEELLYWLHIPGWLTSWASSAQPRRLLDVGAGYGTLAIFSAVATSATIYCLDFETHRIGLDIRDRYRLEVAAGNIEIDEIPWDKPMDAVVMTEVLEHFNFHPEPTMRKIARALTTGGRLFLSTPDAVSWGQVEGAPATYATLPMPDSGIPTEDRHIYQFTEDEVRRLLDDCGFEVLRLERAPGRWGLHLNLEASKR